MKYWLLSQYLREKHTDMRFNVRDKIMFRYNGEWHELKHINLQINYGYGYKTYILTNSKGWRYPVMSSEYLYESEKS